MTSVLKSRAGLQQIYSTTKSQACIQQAFRKNEPIAF